MAAIDVTGGVRLWSVPDGKPLGAFAGNGSPGCIAFAPNGKLLAVSNKGVVKIWDLTTRRSPRSRRAPLHKTPVNALIVTPTGSAIITAAEDGSVVLWTIPDGK